MTTRKIVVTVDGGSAEDFARIANDVWARLSDPDEGMTIGVALENAPPWNVLNEDFERRYASAPEWGAHPKRGR